MRQRVITAILLAIPALLALGLHTPWPLAALGLIAAAIGGNEADRILKTRFPICTIVSFLFFAALVFPVLNLIGGFGLAAVMLASAACFGVTSAGLPERMGLKEFGRLFAGCWVAAPLLAILLLHRSGTKVYGDWVVSPALMALVPVWAGDIAAIFAGKAFGKHPLAPAISPKKTVEGSLANLVAAMVVAALLGSWLGLPLVRTVSAGLAVGILGQAGDLFESWLKRKADLKDSGTLLPGHGGVLDRIDSVLFAAPAVALILLS